MNQFQRSICVAFSLAASFPLLAQKPSGSMKPLPLCSTEVINRHDCELVIDREYPMGPPTAIQMDHGKRIRVEVINAVAFENLYLENVSGQLVPPSDQGVTFFNSALPSFKSFVSSTRVTTAAAPEITENFTERAHSLFGDKPAPDPTGTVRDDLIALNKLLDTAGTTQLEADKLQSDIIALYTQLQESISPLPRPLDNAATRGSLAPYRGSVTPNSTPDLWDAKHIEEWKEFLSVELIGGVCTLQPKDCPAITNVVGRSIQLQMELAPTTTSGTSSPTPSYFSQKDFDAETAKTADDLKALSDIQQQTATRYLNLILEKKNGLVTSLSADYAAIPGVIKDLESCSMNIRFLDTKTPPTQELGQIYDVRERNQPSTANGLLAPLGTWAVTVVNLVSTSQASSAASSARKQIVSVTVIYADPVFETSTGAFFSSLPNRSFANQTLVTVNPDGSALQGNVVIAQTVGHPVVVPFVAANWRFTPNFTFAHRRSAFYATTAIGVNPYNTTTEFGVGPSMSWRSFVFSGLYHLGHDVRLTQNEYLGMVWCNVTAASPDGKIQKCSGSPPAPSMEKFWTGAFAFGISVRIPSTFGSGGSAITSK